MPRIGRSRPVSNYRVSKSIPQQLLISCSGSFAVAPVAFSGTATEGNYGIFALAPVAFSGTVAVGVVGSGTFTVAPVAFSGIETETINSTGSFALAPVAFSGSGTELFPFPQFPLGLLVEILINGTWLDITSLVYQRSDITITRGLPNETQSATPSQMTLTLNNRDGRFSVNNPAGAYYPFITRNTQLRVSVTGNSGSVTGVVYNGYRFWGELSAIPPLWDNTGSDVYVQATVSGPFRRYVQAAKMGSALRQYYSTLTGNFAPYAAWPCEDGSTAAQIASLIPTVSAMSFTGQPSFASNADFGGSDPIPAVNGSVWHGQTGAPSTAPGTGSITQVNPGAYSWTAPQGVTAVTSVQATGGGGGGGDTNGTTGGSGGGGGGTRVSSSITVTPGSSYPYVVGAGGAAGAAGAGAAGGSSSFTGDSAVVVTGLGGGGGGSAGGTQGAAGSSSGSGTGHSGGHGGTGQTSATSSSSLELDGFTGSTGGGSGGSAGTVTQNWTAPTGTSSVSVQSVAGGGGGGGGSAFPSGGGGAANGAGGGGGGESNDTLTVTPGNTYVVTAGNGGNGGYADFSDGDSGGDSSFTNDGSTLVADGGGFGELGSHSNSAGSGGSGTTNDGGDGDRIVGDGGTSGDGSSGGEGGGNFNGTGRAGIFGGGGGGGGVNGSLTAGRNAGGGGGGYVFWTWTQTSAPAGGGGGGSGGSAATGNNGSNNGTGGAAVTGGGAGGTAGPVPSGATPGGGGAGAVPANPTAGNMASSSGAGAPGEVAFSWSGGATSPLAGDVIRFLLDVDPAGAADGAVLVKILTHGTVAETDVIYHTGGNLELKGFNASAAQVFDSGSLAFGADGQPLYVSVDLTASGTSVVWSISAIIPGSGTVIAPSGHTGTITTSAIEYVSDVYVDPAGAVTDSGTAVGWITVQTQADSLVNVSPIANGYAGELASVRIARLCVTQGLGFELAGSDADTPQMGPQQDDTFLNVVQSCCDLDRGQLYETRDQFGVGYRTRVSMQNQNVALIASYSAGTLAQNLQPTADDQFVRNSITVTRNGGASSSASLLTGPMSTLTPPNGIGLYTYSLTVQAFADSQLKNLVAWILTTGTVNEYRFPVISFDMRRPEVANLFAVIPGLNIGDYVQVPDPPAFLQNAPINQLAYGFTETLNAYRWLIAVNSVPEDPYTGSSLPAW